jgi:EF-hand domain pair
MWTEMGTLEYLCTSQLSASCAPAPVSSFSLFFYNYNSEIEYTEFLGATIEARGHIEELRVAEAFDRLDADDSGYITKADLKSVMGNNFSPKRIEELMAEADSDHDGKISYPEFLALFRQETHQLAIDVIREAASDTGSDGSGEEEEQLLGLDAHIPGGLYDSHLGPSEQKQADRIREMSVEI